MYENIIPSPLILWSVANKYREATFMRISGVLCKHPGKISGDKGDHSRLGRMVKQIDFWYGKKVQYKGIDVNESKRSQNKYQTHLMCHQARVILTVSMKTQPLFLDIKQPMMVVERQTAFLINPKNVGWNFGLDLIVNFCPQVQYKTLQ